MVHPVGEEDTISDDSAIESVEEMRLNGRLRYEVCWRRRQLYLSMPSDHLRRTACVCGVRCIRSYTKRRELLVFRFPPILG